MESTKKQFIQCFRPIFLTMFASGCLSFRVNAEHKLVISNFSKLYTNLARLAALGSLIIGFALKMASQRYSQHLHELSSLIKFLTLAEQMMTVMEFLEVSVILDVKKRDHIELFERAYQLDKMLVDDFSVNFNYEKSVRKNAINVTVMNLYCVIYYICYYILSVDSDWRLGMLAVGTVACTIGPNTSTLAHIGAMDFFRVRFRLFQVMLKRYFTLNPREAHARRQRIILLLKHYQKYCELVQSVNHVYGPVALATYFHDFTQCTTMVFVLCDMALQSKSSIQGYVINFLFVLPRLIKLICTVIYARSTYNESAVCSKIIRTYCKYYREIGIKENIHAFYLWNKHNTAQFRVGTAMKPNEALIYSFLLGIGNYVLILMQLKFQEDSITERLRGSFMGRDLNSASTSTTLSIDN